MTATDLMANAYSSGEIFNNDFALMSRYFVNTALDFGIRSLGDRGFLGVNLRLQKTTQNKSIGVQSQDRGTQF